MTKAGFTPGPGSSGVDLVVPDGNREVTGGDQIANERNVVSAQSIHRPFGNEVLGNGTQDGDALGGSPRRRFDDRRVQFPPNAQKSTIPIPLRGEREFGPAGRRRAGAVGPFDHLSAVTHVERVIDRGRLTISDGLVCDTGHSLSR